MDDPEEITQELDPKDLEIQPYELTSNDLIRILEKGEDYTNLKLKELEIEASKPIQYTPEIIKEHLDLYVVGQEDAKRVYSTAIYNHLRRVEILKRFPDKKIDKSNLVLVGPTGVGKTFIAETASKYVDIPMVVFNCAGLTGPGYVGDNPSTFMKALITEAEGNVELAQKGIVILDEFDKKIMQGSGRERDVSGADVQNLLLKIIEGQKYHEQERFGEFEFDTTNTLFIASGAFSEQTSTRINKPTGFGAKERTRDEKTIEKINRQRIIEAGIQPQFLDRFPYFTTLDSLTSDQLLEILYNENSSPIAQKQFEFSYDGIDLIVADSVYKFIVSKAETGSARELKQIFSILIEDLEYEAPSSNQKEFTLDLEYAKKAWEKRK